VSSRWDIDGSEYVDLVSELLPNILGARDHDVDAAIRRQLNSGISFSLATELEAQLAETLCRIIPCAELLSEDTTTYNRRKIGAWCRSNASSRPACARLRTRHLSASLRRLNVSEA
jgi:hypothetical protein